MVLTVIDEAMAAGAREQPACQTIGLTARTVQRWRKQGETGEDRRQGPRQRPQNALTDTERKVVLQTVNSQEYRNLSPNQIVPKLADAGTYLCSEATMHRILRAEDQLTHRQASAPAKKRPRSSHEATGPNEVYSWDITYLKSNIRGIFFYLQTS